MFVESKAKLISMDPEKDPYWHSRKKQYRKLLIDPECLDRSISIYSSEHNGYISAVPVGGSRRYGMIDACFSKKEIVEKIVEELNNQNLTGFPNASVERNSDCSWNEWTVSYGDKIFIGKYSEMSPHQRGRAFGYKDQEIIDIYGEDSL